jgi:hypothetical protein
VKRSPEPARVWVFQQAPAYLQRLSTNGGDEDWIVELPPGLEDYGLPYWVECTDSCHEPDRFDHPRRKGWSVVIGSHA